MTAIERLPTPPPPTKSPRPAAATSAKQRGRPWTVDAIAAIVDGTSAEDPASKDRKGLTSATAAALIAAVQSDKLLPLLDLLTPTPTENAQMKLLLDLVEKIAESQIRIESRLAALESRLVGRK